MPSVVGCLFLFCFLKQNNNHFCSICTHNRICDGLKNPDEVLRQQIAKYKAVFIEAARKVSDGILSKSCSQKNISMNKSIVHSACLVSYTYI